MGGEPGIFWFRFIFSFKSRALDPSASVPPQIHWSTLSQKQQDNLQEPDAQVISHQREPGGDGSGGLHRQGGQDGVAKDHQDPLFLGDASGSGQGEKCQGDQM